MAVDAIRMDGRTVLPGDVKRIMATRSGSPAASNEDPQQNALRHQTLRLADIAAEAAASSATFGSDLSDALHAIDGTSASTRTVVEAMVGRTHQAEADLRSASREIEALRQMVETARDDAQRDMLTGLLNRRGLMPELASRSKSDMGVVALCDIDHFKSINDRFGHAVGDRVLKSVATSLAESCQVHTVARWGGEEFLINLEGLSMPHALRILERACADLAARSFRIRESDQPIGQITVSVGAASLHGQDVEEAIELADRRLYAAKHAGRNRIVSAPTDGSQDGGG